MDLSRSTTRPWCIALALACAPLIADAQIVSGTWTGSGTNWTTTAGNVTITASASGPMGPFAPDILGCAGAYSTSAVDLKPSLLIRYTDFTQTGTLTFTFSTPVKDPILHLDRIGGNQLLLATSGMLSIETPAVTWTKLSANGTHFTTSGTTVYRATSVLCASGVECGSALSIVLGGPASGSLQVNGTISSLTLSCVAAPGIPLGNPGDEFEITWSAVTQAPVAGDDAFALNEDGALNTSVTGNDSDPDTPSAQLVWSLVNGGTAAANGALTLNANGTFSYVPAPNFNGVVSFTYRVCDPNGACDDATVTLSVAAINDQPVALDDLFHTAEDVTLNASVGTNDSDVETLAAGLTWSLVNGGTAAANGTLTLLPNGTFSYAPNADFNGTVSFTYRVCDPSSSCGQAVATIIVDPVNDPPHAGADAFTMPEDGTLNSTVAGNDGDVDDPNGDLTWSLVSGGSAAANGALSLQPNGAFTYTPAPNFFGVVSFTYRLCDDGGLCVQTTAAITVTPVNDPPVAGDDGFTMNEDAVLNASVTANDGDVDDALPALAWSLVSGGSAAANGVLVFNPDGSFSYTPAVNFSGTVNFTYRLCDAAVACDPATVTITVTPVNDAPVANDDNATVAEDVVLNGSVAGNDIDVDNPAAQLTWSLLDGGTAVVDGTLLFNADGTFTFTPVLDFTGTVWFTYRLCDPGPLCDDATVTIVVGSTNDPPVAMDDAFSLLEDGSLSASVAGNDSDPDGDPLVWSLIDGGSAAANGALVFNPDGSFQFTPYADRNGVVSFTYQACDPSSVCGHATATITIDPVNDAPFAGDDAFTMLEDGSLSNAVSGNDGDAETAPAGLVWSLVDGGTAAANGVLVFLADGTFTYAPDADVNGTVTFIYALCDPGGLCDQATVTITIGPVNDAPFAGDDAFSLPEDGSLSAAVSGNDGDPDHSSAQLTWSLVDGGTAAANGALVLHPDGTFTYAPNANVNGTFVFTYQVCDPLGACDPAVVVLSVLPVNDPPVAVDDAFVMDEEGVLNTSAAANDGDVDGDPLSFMLVDGGTAAASGSLVFAPDGTFLYAPATDVNGLVSFTYRACDGDGACDEAVVTITITPVNDVPLARDDAFSMLEDGILSGDVTPNDEDVDGDVLTWSLIDGGSAAANGSLTLQPDGSFIYVPAADLNGVVGFRYQVCDPSGACDPADVLITISPVNDGPVAVDDGFTMSEDGALSASVATNDSDPDNTLLQLTWSLVSGGTAAANGVLSLNADGTFAYTPAPDFHGTVGFSYEVCDLDGACAPAVVTIVVDPVNDGPVAGDDGYDMDEDDVLSASVAGNDSDPDGDALTWSLVSGGSAASNGVLMFNSDGSFTYTPAVDYSGTVSFTYEACDPSAACALAVVTIVVHPMNDGPVAQDDGYDMNEDDVLNASVAGNDSDPDGDALTWSLVSGGSAAANGTLVFNGDGSFSYTPSADYSGTVSFMYEACDPSAVCDPAVVTIVVHPVNDGPVAQDDGYDMDEDDVLSASVSGNDSDPDGDALVWSLVSGGSAAANGVLVFNGDGSFTYTPAADYSGTVSFTYEACDPGAVCAPAVVTIVVHPVNDSPVAGNDAFDMNEDDVLNASVSGNDSDPDGDALMWSLVSGGTASVNGVLVFNGDGSFNYTPASDYTGTVSFTYEACDPSAVCAPAVVTIVVHPVNDGPVAGDDGFDMNEDDVLSASVAGNDSDVDGDVLVWSLVNGGSAAANGTLVFNSDGSFSYTPAADYTGTVTFSYEACDPSAVCAPAVVTIVVDPVNDGPVAGDDGFDMNEDDVLSASVAGNDSDPDGDALTWSLVSGGSAAANGTLVFNNDGSFTYTPSANYTGTVSFMYEACDPSAVCTPAVVTIVVHPMNDGPVAQDDGYDVNEDDVLSASVAGNDSDPDGDALTWSLVSGGSAASNGTLVFNSDGSFSYTPATDYTGTVSFTYEACDPSAACDPAVVTIVVHPVNDGPVAGDDGFDMNEDDVLSASVAGNDSDPDGDLLTWSLVSGGTAASNGVLVFNSDGSFTYTPAANYTGTVSFTYEACDPSAVCVPAVVTIVVHPVNDGPVAGGDGFDMDEDGVLSASVAGNDSDVDGDVLVWSLVSGSTAAVNGTLVFNNDGSFTYTPAADYSGTVSFTYETCDPSAVCVPAVVTIVVHPVNDGPATQDDGYDMNEDDVLSASVAGNDSDPDGDALTWSLVSGGSSASNGVLVFNNDGSFTYTPAIDYTGTVSFIYEACDPSAVCAPGVVTIVVHPVNDGPVAGDDGFDMNEDDVLSALVAGNDSDVDGDALTWSLVSGGSAASNGTLVFNSDGSFNYTPASDYTGTVSFAYEACDPSAACDPAVVTIVVHPVNDVPVAQDDGYDMNEDDVLSASVSGNDSDPDGDALVWSLVSGGSAVSYGILVFNNDGTFSYTPSADYTGTVTFSYEACDPSTVCAPAVVTIVVHPVNDGPVAGNDSYDMNEDDVLNTSVSGNDSDPDGDALTWSLVSGSSAAANGTLVFNNDGTFSYTPSADYTGTVTFSYEACDPSTVCAPAVVTIVVHPVNDGPVAQDDSYDMNEDDVLSASVGGNDSDPDGDALVWSLVSGGSAASNGTLVFNGDGSFTYTPVADYTGTVSFTYEACDPIAVCAPAVVTIVVHPVNDGPMAQDDSYDMNEDDVLSASVGGNDSDPDGDALGWSLVSGGSAAANGTLVFNNNGSFTYTPSADYAGTVSFTYEACDPSAVCAPAVVTIVVNPVNDGPMAEDDSYDMNEDDVLSASVAGNDSDPDGDVLTWSLVNDGSAAANGTLVFNNNGSFTYTPSADYAGTVSFTYEACDPSAMCAPAVVTIVVHSVNDGPVAGDDGFDMNEDDVLNASVSGNDSDVDGDALVWSLVSGGTAAVNGTLVFNSDGSFTYTPAADYSGTVNFTYKACDPSAACASAVVTIVVHPVNDGPVAQDDGYDMNEDDVLSVSVSGNDSDVDGDALVWSLVSGGSAAANGTLVFNNDGSFSYTPAVDYTGTVTFSYEACDPSAVCVPAVVTIVVHPVNDGPVAQDDSYDMNEDDVLSGSVAGNDNDVDGDALTWSLVSGGSAASNGVLVFNNDGSFTYTPAVDYTGTVSFSYEACDPSVVCAPAVVTIVVHPVNDGPMAGDDGFDMNEDDVLSASVSGNDSDPDGDALVWSLVSGGSAASNGVLVFNNDGSFSYTPSVDYTGTVSFTYEACDPSAVCAPGVVTIVVHPVNDGPVAGDDGYDMNEDDVLSASVAGNDSDPDGDALVWSLVSGGSAAANGILVFNNDGSFSYTPSVDYVGTVSFTYETCDPSAVCAPAVVTIVVHPVNDGPMAGDDGFDMDEDDVLSASVAGNDSDPDGDALTWSLVSGGSAAANGTLVFNGDGSFGYTPSADYSGTVSFTYEACDPSAVCDPGVVTIVVHPINDPPIAVDDAMTTDQNTGTTIAVLPNDSDPDGDALTVTTATALHGTVSINGDGTLWYEPTADWCGTDTISYTVCDGGPLCAGAIVVVTVDCLPPVNHAPVAVDDAATTDQNTGTTIAVLPNDSDPDGDALTVTMATALHGAVSINGDGTLWYEPTVDWCGTDTISYTVCDGGPLCAGAIVVVTVDCLPPVNHAPVAVDDAATTDQNTGTTIAVLPNDSDPDGDALMVTTATALHGAVSINGDGTLWYEPTADWCGTDTISYTVCDGGPLCAGAIVVVTVDCPPPVNHAPVAVDDAVTIDQNTGTTIVVLTNDSDPDGDALMVTAATAVRGVVLLNADGTLDYKPEPDHCGTDTISYAVCDGGALCDQALVVVTITCTHAWKVPQGFSPNGDGIGDTWVIQGIDAYPQATVSIINRWGSEVFKASPYATAWDGRSSQGLLPAGTYWYIIDLGVEGREPLSGYVYLNR